MSSTSKTSHGPPPTKRGLEYDLAIASLIKAIRRADERLALDVAIDLDESGYSAALWRRLLIASVEDIGLADPAAATDVNALHDTWLKLSAKKDDRSCAWRLPLVQAVMRLVRAKKSRTVNHALCALYGQEGKLEVPDWCYDRHSKAGRKRGADWTQFFEEAALLADPDTGELSLDGGTIPDPYRDAAIEAVTAPKKPRQIVAPAQTEMGVESS